MDTRPSDNDLVDAHLSGDPAAFNTLVAQYLHPVYAFVRRWIREEPEAEDVTQEVFLRAWQKIGSFDRSKPFKPWIVRIARNACIDHGRRKKTIPFSALQAEEDDTDLTEMIPDPEPLPPDMFDREHVGRELADAIQTLPEKQRQVILLHHEQGLSLSEVAMVMDASVNTIKSRHLRALAFLRETLMHNKEGK